MSDESTPTPDPDAGAASATQPAPDAPVAESPTPNPTGRPAAAARSPGRLRGLLRLLGAPLRLLPFERKRSAPAAQQDVEVEPPPGGPAAQAAAAPSPPPAPTPPAGSQAAADTPTDADTTSEAAPGLLANPRVQLALAALAGAIIAVVGGLGGGFLQRVESDDALVDEAAAQAVVETDDDHASETADQGIPSAPGVGDAGDGVESVADADGSEVEASGADPGAASDLPAASGVQDDPDYLRGYFDGQTCALLDPATAECLSPAEVIARLNSAYQDGWAAALRSVGVAPALSSGAAAASGGGPPRILELKRIEVEDLNGD